MKPIFILLFATALIATQQTFAVPAYPNPINYTLPDGTEITIQLRGDEWLNWAETPDGFTLLRNLEGFFEYATLNELGDLALSGVRVNDMSRRTSGEQDFLHTLERGLMFSEFQIERKLEFRRIRDEFLQEGAEESLQRVSGSVRVPVILVGFSDRPFTRPRADIEMLFNQLNYTAGGAFGSVRDYFLAVSYGALDLQADIFGPFNLPAPIINFTNNTQWEDGPPCAPGNSQDMARQAIDLAISAGANFATYAVGGVVPTVHIIFAGYGTEAGAPRCASIWSHAWSIQPAITRQGVTLRRFCTSPEYRGNSGTLPGTIGTIVHELGHSILGWPDSYSVERGVGTGNCVHLGNWCVMASGSWLGSPAGSRPSRPSAWFVVDAGWTPEILLSTSQNVTMQTGTVFRINTTTTNEYFLLENRQRVGWDALIPASGMLIYHVDRRPVALADWNNNEILTRCHQRRLYIKQAGCATANGCAGNRANDVWPRTGFTEFTDNSTPNARSWAGANTNSSVTNITHNANAGTVSFMFTLPPPTISGPNLICTSAQYTIANFPNGATVTWTVGSGLTPHQATGQTITVHRAGSYSGTSSITAKIDFSGWANPIFLNRYDLYVGAPSPDRIGSLHDGQQMNGTFSEILRYNNTALINGGMPHGIFNVEWQRVPATPPFEVLMAIFPTPMPGYVFGAHRDLDIHHFTTVGNQQVARIQVRMQNECGWGGWKTLTYLAPPPACPVCGIQHSPQCVTFEPICDCFGAGCLLCNCPCDCPPWIPCPHPCDLVFTYSPNPANDELIIDFQHIPTTEGKTETYSIKLLNNLGFVQRESVFNHRRADGRTRSVKIDVSALPEGTYYLHIEANGEIYKEQIVIKRK